jgi:hypothetical protein
MRDTPRNSIAAVMSRPRLLTAHDRDVAVTQRLYGTQPSADAHFASGVRQN